MTSSPESTSSIVDLFRRWRDGEKKALDELITILQPWLHQEVRSALGGGARGVQDSLDLAQNAVLNFLTWGPRFVPSSDAQLRALLRRIATNQVIDEHRRHARRGAAGHVESLRSGGHSFSGFGPAQNSSLDPSREIERGDDIAWVRLALQFLEPDDRHLLLASEIEGLDWATIAAEIGIASADTARMRCARLKPKIALLLLKLRRGEMPATA